MDKQEVERQVEQYEASRPGPKTFAAALLVGLAVVAYYNWTDIKAALDFI